jgi:hypothetical protein
LSGNPNLAFNGQRMQAAAERYRTNTVIQPGDPMAMTLAGTPNATQQSSSNGNSQGGTNSGSTTIVVGAPAAATAATP